MNLDLRLGELPETTAVTDALVRLVIAIARGDERRPVVGSHMGNTEPRASKSRGDSGWTVVTANARGRG